MELNDEIRKNSSGTLENSAEVFLVILYFIISRVCSPHTNHVSRHICVRQ